jgi:hypothetical protein
MLGRPKTSRNKAPQIAAFINDVERRLTQAGFDGGLERQACRFITGDDLKVAAMVWKTLMEYKFGRPADPDSDGKSTFNFVVLNNAVVRQMNDRDATPIESRLLSDADPAGTSPV